MTISDNRYSQRLGRAIGGSEAAGPLSQFPLDITANLDYCTWFNDFISVEDYDDAGDQPWINTDIGVPAADGAAIAADTLDGVLLLNAGTTVDTGLSLQYAGTDAAGAFLDRGDHMGFSFGCRLKKNVAANGAVFVGLMIPDVTPMAAATGALTASDYIGFWTAEDTAALILTSVRGGGTITFGDTGLGTTTLASAQSLTLVDDTYVDVAFVCYANDISVSGNSGRIEAFRRVAGAAGAPTGVSHPRWASIGQIQNTAIPDAGVDLCPTIIGKNGPVLLIDLSVDYFWLSSRRL